MREPAPIVFLLEVDNTVLNNDHVIADLKAYLLRDFDTLGVVGGAGASRPK